MKNPIRYIGILAAAALIVFAFASCGDTPGDDTAGSGPSIENWSEVTLFPGDTSGWIYAVTWGNGVYVASSDEGRLAYSNNVKNWTDVSGLPLYSSQHRITSAAYGNNRFVIGGHSSQSPSHGIVGTSTDGTSWQTYNTPAGLDDFTSIIWADNKFIATAYEKIWYSPTGLSGSWIEAGIVPAANYNFRCVAYGGNKFIATGSADKPPCIAVSTDGINWIATDLSDVMPNNLVINPIEKIAYGNGTFVMGGYAGAMAYSTDNGDTWTRVVNSTFGTTTVTGITWGNDTFVAVGYNKVAYSSDGITWKGLTFDKYPTPELLSVNYCDGTFIAGGKHSLIMYCTVK